MCAEKSLLMISNLTGQMGKGQSVCETLAQLLRSKDWKVYTASAESNKALRLMDMLSTAWRNRNQYQAGYIEVYSGLGFIWAEIMSLFLRSLRRPFVLALYGGNLPKFGGQHPKRMRHLLSSAKYVLSPSAYTMELMRDFRNDILVLPYGMDLSQYQFRLRNSPKLKMLTMRAFHSMYNLHLAPQVLALLVNEYKMEAQLVMTGSDKGDGTLEKVIETAKRLNVHEYLNITGFVPRKKLPSIINSADILLNTTNVDNTPVSVLEAMACGLCVVSTNVGGIPYLLGDEQDALLVPPGDVGAMAAAVRRVLIKPGLAERLSRNARHKAEQFDWSMILPKWETLFQELVHHA